MCKNRVVLYLVLGVFFGLTTNEASAGWRYRNGYPCYHARADAWRGAMYERRDCERAIKREIRDRNHANANKWRQGMLERRARERYYNRRGY